VERLTLGYFFVRRDFLAKKEEETQRLLKLSEEAREKLEQEEALRELKEEIGGDDEDVEEVD
jgi:ABC-type nitrate/sulfonate/bicarbonate transport system substrate-binding protein